MAEEPIPDMVRTRAQHQRSFFMWRSPAALVTHPSRDGVLCYVRVCEPFSKRGGLSDHVRSHGCPSQAAIAKRGLPGKGLLRTWPRRGYVLAVMG